MDVMKSKLNNYVPILNFGLSKGCLTISFNKINFHNTIFKIFKNVVFLEIHNLFKVHESFTT